jgi:GYF domain 2
MSDAWYYVENGAQAGPITFDELQHLLRSARGGKNLLVWRKGMSSWQAAGGLPELDAVFLGPPAMPGSAMQSSPAAPSAPLAAEPATDPPAEQSTGRKVLGIAVSILGAVIGIVVVRTFGVATLIWPAALIAIAWFVLVKCNVEAAAVPMLAILLGHTGWMIVGHVTLYLMGRLTSDQLWFLVDAVLVLGLTIWFLAARSRASAIGILVYQTCALAFGVLTLGDISLPISSQALMLAQILHIILRLAGIGLCIYAIVMLGRQAASAEPAGA